MAVPAVPPGCSLAWEPAHRTADTMRCGVGAAAGRLKPAVLAPQGRYGRGTRVASPNWGSQGPSWEVLFGAS